MKSILFALIILLSIISCRSYRNATNDDISKLSYICRNTGGYHQPYFDHFYKNDTLFKNVEKVFQISDSIFTIYTGKVLINNPRTAIKIVEPILFSYFGKKSVIKGRPYTVFFLDGYYYIIGTPKRKPGGTYYIVINSRTCEIIDINQTR